MPAACSRLLLTPGEPAGIGPDLVLQAAAQAQPASLVAVADQTLLQQRAAQLGLAVQLTPYNPAQIQPHQAGVLPVWHTPLRAPVQCGVLNPANSAYVLETLRIATQACLRGEADALVTAPVHKGVINDAGVVFSGHTEFLAELSGGEPVMMLACPGLRVALVTTHLPLRQIADAISAPRLERVLRILHGDLIRRFGLDAPHILVCGLNPHAGEGGHLGREEIDIIEPVLTRLRTEGWRLTGPLPADTLFTPKYLQQADAVLAMYHDQGLPVLKHLGFGQAVNITLGLPLIRTSVDHGTALDLAGTGRAEVGSLLAAITTAAFMAHHHQTQSHATPSP